MAYPGSLDSFSPRTDNVDDVMAADVNGLQTAIAAVETELGTDPAGTATDLVTRLAQSLDGLGNVAFADATTKTISGGAITITQNFHRVDSEGGAASDDLVTINGFGTQAMFGVLRLQSGAHNVVIKHNGSGGNIQCVGGSDITLDNTFDWALYLYDPTLTKVLVFSAGALTGAVTLAGTNTWTGVNSWSAAVGYKYTAVSTNTTLDTTHYMVNVDASGGAKTITLPTAVGVTGRHYIIRKSDSSANAVTVDANGSETINGALTNALTAQYQTVSIMSDGAGWMIL